MRLNLNTQSKVKMTAKDITLIALMVAVIEVSKVALAQIPNVELTSFWIIMFGLYFGSRIFYVIPVFILIEGVMFGFGFWWVMYLYAWPLLGMVTIMMRKSKNTVWDWSIASGIFGLLFGFMCAIPYIFISGVRGAFTWWIVGIPWDLVHGFANFAIMFVLYEPMKRVMTKITNTESKS